VCFGQREKAVEEVRIIAAEKKIQFTFHLNSANTVAPSRGGNEQEEIGGISEGQKSRKKGFV
jgi:hypothetical protein